MMNYEKARLNNGSTYSIVPGGIMKTEEKLELILILPAGKTLEEVDAETEIQENVQSIKLIDMDGDVYNVVKGYVSQVECSKKKNYIIGTERVETGEYGTESFNAESVDVFGTVIKLALEKSDIRREVEKLKETVGMMLVKDLEV